MKKYKTEFSREELHAALHANDNEAAAIIKDEDKWNRFKGRMDAFMQKAEKIPVLGSMIEDILCMAALADSYVKKEYRDIPAATIISIVAALIYLLSPIDMIPDVIPFIGYLDDAAIVLLVLNLGVEKDLDKYKKWHEDNRKRALSELEKVLADEFSSVIENGFLAAVILGESNIIRLLVSENMEGSLPIECTVKVVKAPRKLLWEYSIEDDLEILEVLNHALVLDSINWMKFTEKRAFLEPDFEAKWDDYIIMEGC